MAPRLKAEPQAYGAIRAGVLISALSARVRQQDVAVVLRPYINRPRPRA
jgi:hypothetical protein